MHYRNGRLAQNGDKVIQLDSEGHVVSAGVLYGATPGNDYCNGNLAPIQNPVTGACMCDCLHVDDLAVILTEKGLASRPTIKG